MYSVQEGAFASRIEVSHLDELDECWMLNAG